MIDRSPTSYSIAVDTATNEAILRPIPDFLKSPGEVRKETYQMLLSTWYGVQCSSFPGAAWKIAFHPAILQVNRQILAGGSSHTPRDEHSDR